jgi:type II secretory pathway component PulC
MRLVAGVLALTLFAPLVRAEDTGTPARPSPSAAVRSRVPLRVVRVMPESHQALLFDRSRETHVLADVGATIHGYSVDAIDDDEVILSRDGTQIVLAAPAHPRERRRERDRDGGDDRDGARRADPVTDPAPIDPYGDGEPRAVTAPDTDARGPGAPASPRRATGAIEAGDGGVRIARAPTGSPGPARPIEPGSDGVRVAQAPLEPEPAPSADRTRAPAPPDVRVAEAPPADPRSSGTPGAPAGFSAAPSAGVPSASASGAPSANASGAPSVNASGASEAVSPITPSLESSASASLVAPSPAPPPTGAPSVARPTGAASPDARSLGIVPTTSPPPEARSPEARLADAPVAAPAPARPAGKTARAAKATKAGRQALDARAFADGLSADRGSRSRSPASASPPNAAASEAPTSPAVRTQSEARTAPVVAPGDAPAGAPADAIVLSRGEVDSALADFAKLTAAIRASFSDTGVVVDDVRSGTIFQRAGLRAGDTITAIDGTRLRSLDDAANLYARAATARSLTVQLLRGGAPVTLRVVIQ